MTALTASVIIPSLNSPIIDRVVDAVLSQTQLPLEIIVVGRDESGELSAVQADPRLRFIDTERPISPAKARNLGARIARGDVLCFIDADAVADPDWLKYLLNRHATGATVVGGGVTLPAGGYWFQCDNSASFADFMYSALPGVRTHLPSLNFSLRRTLFLEMGGFDERFPSAASEDTDLCFRLRKANHTLNFEPQALVTHYAARHTFPQMWAHLRQYGREYITLQRLHQDLIGPSVRVQLAQRSAILGVLAAPGWAMLETLQWLRRGRIKPYLFAGVFLARTAYYFGLTIDDCK